MPYLSSTGLSSADENYEWRKVQKVLVDAKCSEKINLFMKEGIVALDTLFAIQRIDLDRMGFNVGMTIRLRTVMRTLSADVNF